MECSENGRYNLQYHMHRKVTQINTNIDIKDITTIVRVDSIIFRVVIMIRRLVDL